MGPSKLVVIESKGFEVVREGRLVHIRMEGGESGQFELKYGKLVYQSSGGLLEDWEEGVLLST